MGARGRGRMLLAVVLPVLLVMGALYAAAAQALDNEQRRTLSAALGADARRLAVQLAGRWSAGGPPPPGEPCPPAPGLRVRVVLPGDGPACATARADVPDDAELAAARDAALHGHITRSDPAGPAPYLAVTVPVHAGGQVVAALQAVQVELPDAAGLPALRVAFLLGTLALLGAVLGLAWLGTRTARRRTAALVQALERLEPAGALAEAGSTGALPPRADPVLGPLAEALAQARRSVQARVGRLTQQLDEREAVLASMLEGVLAVEPGGRLLTLNAAAGRMFDIDPSRAQGRDLLEVVRHPELQRLVRDALESAGPLERELTLYGEQPRTLQAHGTALRDRRGQGLGALVVLNDVTHLRRLERMRQDFVANVSHEIKTPITSILGFVETLLDGAIEQPETARRFLEIVGRHAQRLNAITDDLLNLSRIEQGAQQGDLATEEAALPQLLRSAVGVCALKAEARGIRVLLDCPPDLRARINAQLVEQAVVNLVDNAVKYAPAGTEVRVEGDREPGGIVIRVRDQGPGIPAEHQPRLFERFYRVDKARSRKAGGTGLGLAIVKHIAQAHGGRVEVESRFGTGSTFTLHLPDAPAPDA
jgi:two-component system, OmpR family, phosphate regulon sensor histidine kinase PhoR